MLTQAEGKVGTTDQPGLGKGELIFRVERVGFNLRLLPFAASEWCPVD
jgi:hypothetical protein